MKTKIYHLMFFLYFLFIMAILASCNKGLKSNEPINKSETELFQEASQMNGLGIFKIGNTTIKQIIQLNKDIQQDQRYGSLFEGYWIGSKFKVEENVLESCPLTQMYNIDKFFIGDEEINDLNLFFL